MSYIHMIILQIFDKKPVFSSNAKPRIASGMGTKDELENNKKKNAPPAIDKMTTLDEITKPLNRTKDTSTDTRNVKKVNFTSPHFI